VLFAGAARRAGPEHVGVNHGRHQIERLALPGQQLFLP
jgi:hypothetical protein